MYPRILLPFLFARTDMELSVPSALLPGKGSACDVDGHGNERVSEATAAAAAAAASRETDTS